MSSKKRIGDILVANQSITRPAAENAAVETVLANTRILSVLVRDGHLDTQTALCALAEQLGVPGIDVDAVVANGFKEKAIEMWERCLRAASSAELSEQIKQHIVSIL